MRIYCLAIVKLILRPCSLFIKFLLNLIPLIWVTSPYIILWKKKHTFFPCRWFSYLVLLRNIINLISNAVITFKVCCQRFSFSWGLRISLFFKERSTNISYSIILGFCYLWNLLLDNNRYSTHFIFRLSSIFLNVNYFFLNH
jgi:hypothetical protein